MKDQLRRSHPSGATKAAAAKRLGKVQQSKSIQGSVKHRPGVQWEGGGRNGREKGKGQCFGLQISDNIGPDPRWGVRTPGSSSRVGDEDDNTPPKYFHCRLSKNRGSFQPFPLSQITNWVP